MRTRPRSCRRAVPACIGQTLIDTARDDGEEDDGRFAPGEEVGLVARSAKLLIQRTDD